LDSNEETRVRLNALVIFYGGDWDRLYSDEEVLRRDGLGHLLDWVSEQQQSMEPVESTSTGDLPNPGSAAGD